MSEPNKERSTTQDQPLDSNEIRNQHPFRIWESILNNPRILKECLEPENVKQINSIADVFIKKNIQKVFLLGTAASNFAGIAEKYSFEKLLQIPASAHLISEFKNYQPADLNSNSMVFFHSHSGNSRSDAEVAQMVRHLGGYTVGVTDNKDGILGKNVDSLLIGPGGLKKELPATRTYTSAIFRMIQLVIAIGEKKGIKDIAKYQKELLKTPDLLQEQTLNYIQDAHKDFHAIEDCSSFFVIGSGPNFATAKEVAIGFGQSAGMPSQSYQLDTFTHGPIQYLRKGSGVILIANPGPQQKQFMATATACKKIGAKVVLLLPDKVKQPEGMDAIIRIPSSISDLFSPLFFIVPLWILAYQFAVEGRGPHPDRLSMDRPEFKEAFAILKKG